MPDHTEPKTLPFHAPATRPPKPARPHNLDHADPPPNPSDRAKWAEHVLDEDPKARADKRRAQSLGRALGTAPGCAPGGETEGEIVDGVWRRGMSDATRELVRGPRDNPELDQFLTVDLRKPDEDDDEMPALPEPVGDHRLRPRWEAFCRLYAFGHSAADAARNAGYAWGSAAHSGWRLLQDDRVRARIRELQGHLAKTLAVTDEDLVVRAEAVYREAMNRGHYGAAIRAVEFTARERRRRLRAEGSGGGRP
ncbi:MAG: terminase small subunit [Rhodospirillales bacterium]